MKLLKTLLFAALILMMMPGCKSSKDTSDRSVKNVIDEAVTKFYAELKPEQLDTLRENYILQSLSGEDKDILATKFLSFETNVPVTVSLMRHIDQKVIPFWIAESGFKKTDMIVKNEEYTYEVWQKNFDSGKVGLGINGFDKHREVYFISVAPQKQTDSLKITNVFPTQYNQITMKVGAFTYHDWDSLILTEVPESLNGQVLFTTVRGRAREAHLVQAFRKTNTPSSAVPDQILQTWSGDPKTSVDIQWRTSTAVAEGVIKYWQPQTKDTLTKDARVYKMEDRLLQNDRYVHRFTAKVTGLQPGVLYQYKVGSKTGGWSGIATFKTEPASQEPFTFIWFGDTHYSPIWGDMAQKAFKRHPETAFFSIAGDLVSTGLHRNEWDELWKNSGNVFNYKPLMPVPGNHDSQDGLGAWMYQEMFSFPENGPAGLPREMTYSFTYGNALYLMIDATLPVPAQTAWIEEKLKNTTATWKFVMFHFPPYNFVEPYDEIMKEWGTLFDKYHVDMVMNGHMHYYLRTKPMFNKKAVSDPSKGTIYTMSISIPGKQDEWPEEDYAVVRYPDGPLYQHISINGNTLSYKCYDPEGKVKDELVIKK